MISLISADAVDDRGGGPPLFDVLARQIPKPARARFDPSPKPAFDQSLLLPGGMPAVDAISASGGFHGRFFVAYQFVEYEMQVFLGHASPCFGLKAGIELALTCPVDSEF